MFIGFGSHPYVSFWIVGFRQSKGGHETKMVTGIQSLVMFVRVLSNDLDMNRFECTFEKHIIQCLLFAYVFCDGGMALMEGNIGFISVQLSIARTITIVFTQLVWHRIWFTVVAMVAMYDRFDFFCFQ